MGDNGQPDLAGYASVEDLVKAYRSSGDEAKRQRQRADQYEGRARELEQSQRTVTQRSQPADRLTEFGIPVDALDQYIGERIQQGVSKAFEPLTRGLGARNTLLSEYPDYSKYEADVARFIESDPGTQASYQNIFEKDPTAAMEYAFLKFGEVRRKETPSGDTPQRQARQEAQIPSSRQGDARSQPQDGSDRVAQAWEKYQKTGNPTDYAKARLRQAIPDEHLTR